MSARLFLSAMLLLAGSTTAFAQQPATAPAQQLTAAQQAQINQQNQQMVQAAVLVVQMIDQGKSDNVWDGASAVAKQIVAKDAFVKQVAADRKTLGAVKSRTVAAIGRSQGGGTTPAGFYINVAFATQFANAKAPVRELVSFHLDPDKKWRVTGYTVR
jgi:hypothetical protein